MKEACGLSCECGSSCCRAFGQSPVWANEIIQFLFLSQSLLLTHSLLYLLFNQKLKSIDPSLRQVSIPRSPFYLSEIPSLAMTQSFLANGIHLIGSIPLSTSEEVFTTLSEALPGRLFSIPDGETGDRCNFIVWERFRFPVESPAFRHFFEI